MSRSATPARRTLAAQLIAIVDTEPVANVTSRSVPLGSRRTVAGREENGALTFVTSPAVPRLVKDRTTAAPAWK